MVYIVHQLCKLEINFLQDELFYFEFLLLLITFCLKIFIIDTNVNGERVEHPLGAGTISSLTIYWMHPPGAS